jgi:hypothetical protein
MIPSHTSGICACTYHLFYNPTVFTWVVNLQAALTCAGNAALAVAAYRIYAYGKEQAAASSDGAAAASNGDVALSPAPLLEETDAAFNTDMLLKSLLAAVVVKYGELYVDFPFDVHARDALAIIAVPTALNVAKWAGRAAASKGTQQVSGVPL